jgi:hypothetical protein
MVTVLWMFDQCLTVGHAQGSLTPSGGPEPTFKTLSQVEPRTPISSIPVILTDPGSYYFTTNLVQPNNAPGITLSASDITLDLNGFALIGTNGPSAGITTGGTVRTNICIRNGTIRNWDAGLSLSGDAQMIVLERLRVVRNSGDGIFFVGSGTITDCVIANNGRHGLAGSLATMVVKDCEIYQNGLDGIRAGNISLIRGNRVIGPGILGSTNTAVRVGAGCRIEDNFIVDFDNGVVSTGSGNLVVRNFSRNVTVDFNVIAGIIGPTNSASGIATNHPWANFAQ